MKDIIKDKKISRLKQKIEQNMKEKDMKNRI